VCCIFEKSCGEGTVSENNTYFTSSARSAGAACSLTICKSSSDVCQLRLDFETFTLSEAFTSTGGATGDYAFATSIGNCFTDFFSVSVPGGQAPPLICGENTGLHMYVPASESCNAISSSFGTATTATTSAFTIKITQIKCNAKNKAPEGCLQYFTESSGTFQTFNYNAAAGRHLANQDYCFCFRADRTACTICYTPTSAATGPTLGLGNGTPAATLAHVDTMCGYPYGVKVAALDFFSYGDYIVIPNAQCPVTVAAANDVMTVDRFCGTKFACMAGPIQVGTFSALATSLTVCSSTKPFSVCLHTDATEAYETDEALTEVNGLIGTRGFEMRYWQSSSCLLKAFKHDA